MRAERITQRTAAAAWEAAQRVYSGPVNLPTINLGELFKGRKSITWREALASIREAIEKANN